MSSCSRTKNGLLRLPNVLLCLPNVLLSGGCCYCLSAHSSTAAPQSIWMHAVPGSTGLQQLVRAQQPPGCQQGVSALARMATRQTPVEASARALDSCGSASSAADWKSDPGENAASGSASSDGKTDPSWPPLEPAASPLCAVNSRSTSCSLVPSVPRPRACASAVSSPWRSTDRQTGTRTNRNARRHGGAFQPGLGHLGNVAAAETNPCLGAGRAMARVLGFRVPRPRIHTNPPFAFTILSTSTLSL
jgi:hypothetical protein